MPGTITSDQTVINACEATTNFATIGTWGANPAASGDIFLEGSNAINARASAATGPVLQLAWSHSTTAAGLDLSGGAHVYMWIKCFSLPSMEKRVRGGIGVSISADTAPTKTGTDPWSGATNSKQWFVTGADFEPTSGWVCYVIDPTSTPDLSIGTPTMSSVDRVGIRTAALQIVGGGAVKPLPVMWDRIAYGTAMTIKDGTAGAPVTFSDLYAADSATANQYGFIGKATGIYFGAGKFKFGTTGQTAVTVFTDTNQVLVWQDMPVASGFYEFALAGAASFATTMTLGSYAGGLTSGGCVIRGAGLTTRRLIVPVIVAGGTGYTAGDVLTVSGGTFATAAQFKVITVSGGVITEIRMETLGVYSVPPTGTLSVTGGTGASATFTATVAGGSIWVLSASAANQTLNLYGCTLSQMKTAAFASTSVVRGCTFDDFGDITANGALFDGCTFQNLRTGTPISAVYGVKVQTTTATLTNSKFINCATALLWDRNATTSGQLDGSSFTSGGTGHGIELGSNTPTTIGFTSVTFSGYGGTPGSNPISSSGSTDAAIYNNSGKTITINVSGGTTPSVRNGAGATTVVNSTVAVTVTPLTTGSEVRAYLTGTSTEVDGIESSTGSSFTLSLPTGVAVDIIVLNYSPPKVPVRIQNVSFSVNQNIDPGQRDDRNFNNP